MRRGLGVALKKSGNSSCAGDRKLEAGASELSRERVTTKYFANQGSERFAMVCQGLRRDCESPMVR
jgi:hypothetical protein